MSIQKNLIIRQVIGRTLLDAGKLGCGFELGKAEEGWKLKVTGVERELAEHIVSLCSDINVFYHEETSNQPINKWWFYNQNTPSIGYDVSNKELVLFLDSRMSYTNESGKTD